MPIQPTKDTLTVLIKSHKNTALITVKKTTAISNLKKELFSYLQANRQHLEAEFDIPESADEIELGMMIDPAGKDISRGWHVVGKEGRGDVESLGVTDWGVMAWRIKGSRFRVEVPTMEEDEEE